MLEFAHWDGLTYYVKEEAPSKHIVMVQDENGNKSFINLETGIHLYDIETGRRLNGYMPIPQERRIKETLRQQKDYFLKCWDMLNQENSQIPPKTLIRK